MAIVVLIVAGGALLCAGPLGPGRGDPDGDGRYQWIEWDTPDAAGSPTMMRLFTGGSDGVSIAISTPDEGMLGTIGSGGSDVVDRVLSRLLPPLPSVAWDLSAFPPGTHFTFAIDYLDSTGAVLDTETIETVRPER